VGLALALLACTSSCDVGSSSRNPNQVSATPSTDDTWLRAGPTPVEQHGKLSIVGTSLVDENGDAVQLKGVSSMWLNWEDDGFAENPDALLWMRDHWNLSLIRAAMGVDTAGAYLSNPTLAQSEVETIVENAIAAGVYVLVDWHDHHASLHQDAAVSFFADLSAKYAGVPNLIYEPFNEPLAVSWTDELKPYHEAVVAAIRANADNVVVLGTPNWSQDVDVAAAAPLEGMNLAYTLHFYSCSHTAYLRTKASNALDRGLPLFVTEWGATNADGGLDGKVCLQEAATWLTFLADKGVSWTAWKLDNCPVDSTCLLMPNAPVNGGWTQEYLHGHAEFVRDGMRK
jgi:endoglucanase